MKYVDFYITQGFHLILTWIKVGERRYCQVKQGMILKYCTELQPWHVSQYFYLLVWILSIVISSGQQHQSKVRQSQNTSSGHLESVWEYASLRQMYWSKD